MRRPLSSVLLNVSSSLGMIRVYIWWLSSGKYIDTTYGGRRSEDGENERALIVVDSLEISRTSWQLTFLPPYQSLRLLRLWWALSLLSARLGDDVPSRVIQACN